MIYKKISAIPITARIIKFTAMYKTFFPSCPAPFLFTYYLFTLILFINYFILYHHPLLHRILNRTSSVLLFAAPQKRPTMNFFQSIYRKLLTIENQFIIDLFTQIKLFINNVFSVFICFPHHLIRYLLNYPL